MPSNKVPCEKCGKMIDSRGIKSHLMKHDRKNGSSLPFVIKRQPEETRNEYRAGYRDGFADGVYHAALAARRAA